MLLCSCGCSRPGAELEALRAENAELKEVVRLLKAELAADLERRAAYEALQAENDELRLQIEVLMEDPSEESDT